MPFDRPNLTALRQQTATDINAAADGVDAFLRYSNMGIIGEVLAALADGHYGYLDWIALQCVPFTATGEYLEAWAALKDVTRKPATNASGSFTFPATGSSVVPEGTTINRGDGIVYISTADATAASGNVIVPAQAQYSGAAGNALSGIAVSLGIGIAGVTGAGTASSVITGGADIERDDELRSRMLQRYAKPPQGGSIDDYGEWALEVPGVTRTWIVPSGMGPGTIVLLFMMDDAEAAFGGFPQGTDGCATLETRDTAATGDQLALADYIFGKQSVTALVYAVAPLPNTINMTINGLSSATTDTKAAIAAAITAALLIGAKPGGVTNVLPLEAAISSVVGSAGGVLTTITCSAGSVSPGTDGNITSNAGCLPVFGTITWS